LLIFKTFFFVLVTFSLPSAYTYSVSACGRLKPFYFSPVFGAFFISNAHFMRNFFRYVTYTITRNIFQKKGGKVMSRQKIFKKLSVVFYEKDIQLFEDFSKLALEKDDNMSRYVKRMIQEELKKNEK
jgi:hypothetical protein